MDSQTVGTGKDNQGFLSGAEKTKILVLGGGFGGVYSVLHLERLFRKDNKITITLVSEENFFLFTPLLHEVATGGVETRHIAYPIRRLRGRKRFNFRQSEVQSIDLHQKQVRTDRGVMDYDYLVLALGGTTDMTELPNLENNVFTLKTLRDGMLLRNHIIRLFERADAERDLAIQRQLLTFVVAGGGYTGVQLITEMRDFIHRYLLRNYQHIAPASIRIILVQDEKRLLPGMDEKLAAIAHSVIQRKGIEIRMDSQVTRVGREEIELNAKEIIATNCLVWATGIRANPVVAALPVEKDEKGRAIVNEYLEVPGFPGVYAVGDNSHFRDTATGESLPQRAHIAVRQPKVIATNIFADIRGKSRRPYRYSFMGEMVSLGSHSAVAKLYRFRLHGFLAKVVWIVSYEAIMLGPYNRIRVAIDWFLSLLFGRDSTLLQIK